MSGWTSKFFTPAEMACKCGCGVERMHPAFMERLDRLRERHGKGLSPSSAYRCENHSAEKSKTTVGAHRQGRAVDLPCDGQTALRLLSLALELGFTGIGVSQRAGQPRFIHLDDAPAAEGQPRPTVWSY